MAASCHARRTVHLVVPKLRQIQLRLLPIAAPARVVFVQERVVREEGANPRRAWAFGEDHRSKAVSEVVPTPLDKYQDQVEAVSESYGKFQSFQYFCKHDLDIYVTEMVHIPNSENPLRVVARLSDTQRPVREQVRVHEHS